MKLIQVLNAAVVALGVGMGQAGAMPQTSAPADAGDLVIKVQEDCHETVRRHYLPRYDARVWHYHRQSNCRAVVTDPAEEDDYDMPRDCHREVRRHYVPEYGSQVTHRHVGANCRIREYQRSSEEYEGGSCVQIGPIQYCEN
jgi:hypothetical protein